MTDLLTNTTFDFLLVFIRISSALIILPGLSEASVPATVRIGLSLALTAIVMPLVSHLLPAMSFSPVYLLVMIAEQIVVGISIGWLTKTILLSLPLAGQVISYQVGLSSALLPSTELGASSTLVAGIFNLMLPVLFFSSTLILFPVMALVNSFYRIPADIADQSLSHHSLVLFAILVIKAMGAEVLTATQIAAPFLVVGLIWQAALALTARAAPQLQIFFVAAPLQILAGLFLLGLFLSPIVTTWQQETTHALAHFLVL